jgi:hypothetical protein
VGDMRAFAEAAERKLLAVIVNVAGTIQNLVPSAGEANSTGVVTDGWSDAALLARSQLETPMKSLASGEAARKTNAEVWLPLACAVTCCSPCLLLRLSCMCE